MKKLILLLLAIVLVFTSCSGDVNNPIIKECKEFKSYTHPEIGKQGDVPKNKNAIVDAFNTYFSQTPSNSHSYLIKDNKIIYDINNLTATAKDIKYVERLINQGADSFTIGSLPGMTFKSFGNNEKGVMKFNYIFNKENIEAIFYAERSPNKRVFVIKGEDWSVCKNKDIFED